MGEFSRFRCPATELAGPKEGMLPLIVFLARCDYEPNAYHRGSSIAGKLGHLFTWFLLEWDVTTHGSQVAAFSRRLGSAVACHTAAEVERAGTRQ